MAVQPPHVYHPMQQVFSNYEMCKLKGQKARTMTPTNIQKALEGRFSANLLHFQPFQGLKVRRNVYDLSITYSYIIQDDKKKKKKADVLKQVLDHSITWSTQSLHF